MEYNYVKIPLAAAVSLASTVDSLLYKRVTKGKGNDKKTFLEPRKNLPFKISYRLQRNKTALDRDVKIFNDKKTYLLASLGTITEDGTNVEITDEESMRKYNEGLQKILMTPVTHNLMKMYPDDFDIFSKEKLDITPEEMKVLITYMTQDDELVKDLNNPIKFND